MFKNSLIVLSVLALSVAGVAQAKTPATGEAFVSTQGVDFKEPESVEGLYKRIKKAAVKVCFQQNQQINDLSTQAACRREAVSNAVVALGNTQLAQRHFGSKFAEVAQNRAQNASATVEAK